MSEDERYQECWEKALTLLDRRSHSALELRGKLLKRHYPGTIIDRVIRELARLDLVDDRRFAEEYCAYRLGGGRPLGRSRVLAELRRKGISPSVAEAAFEAVDKNDETSELDRALAAGRRKWKSVCQREADERKVRQKVVRFLAGRGFSAGVCYEVVDRLMDKG